MARHPFGPMGRRRARNRTYTVLALLVVVVVIAFMYGPFGAGAEDENKPLENGYSADSNVDVDVPDMNETIVIERPGPNEPVAIAPQLEVIETPEPETVTPEPDVPQIAPEPELAETVESNSEADVLIAKAAGLIGRGTGGIIEARESLNQTLRMPMSPTQREYV